MKKAKTYNLFNKIRAALRDVYRYSPMRKEAIKSVILALPDIKDGFVCPVCKKGWPIQMADVDHEPPLGALTQFVGHQSDCIGPWAARLFNGQVQVLCKLCHKRKTALQRRKKG